MPAQVLAQSSWFTSAVLEQAGYMAQATYLQAFRDFFREAGAFIYILGAVGALISFVVFGSFRAARYLLIGPAFYWLLVGPTFTYDGVVWQIGNSQARGLNFKTGERAAMGDIDEVLAKADLQKPGNGIEVAYGFALIARVINSLTRDFSDLIIQSDVSPYLSLTNKAVSLNLITDSGVTNPELIGIIEGDYLAQCLQAQSYSVARSTFDLTDKGIAVLGAEAKPPALLRRAEYESLANKSLDTTLVNPSLATKRYLEAKGVTDTAKISCREMWKIIVERVEEDSKSTTKKLINLAQGNDPDREKICGKVLEKFIDTGRATAGGGDCETQLNRAVSLMVLKNTLYGRRSSSRFISRVTETLNAPVFSQTDRNDFFNDRVDKNPYLTGLAQDYAKRIANGVQVPGTAFNLALGVWQRGEDLAKHETDAKKAESIRKSYRSAAKNLADAGPMDAGFSDYPQIHLRDLRQQMFTAAMNLPYWQGILLYVLAISYPFLALIVLLPGRALGFINFPMAWLWVKSWDVAFVMAMVFERVLWNLLPSLDIKSELVGQDLANRNPWDLLTETQKFDHVWNLNIYFVSMAMVLFAIPVVTGFATLKSRRAVLSSFVDRLSADAQDAGGLASRAFGHEIMSQREKASMELSAIGASLAGTRPDDPGSPGISRQRHAVAHYYASLATMSKLADLGFAPTVASFREHGDVTKGLAAAGLAVGAGVVNLPTQFAEAAKEYQAVYNKMMVTQLKHDQAYDRAFDPNLGRFGIGPSLFVDHQVASDHNDGYEMNPDASAHAELIALNKEQTKIKLENAVRFQSNLWAELAGPGVASAVTGGQSSRLPGAITEQDMKRQGDMVQKMVFDPTYEPSPARMEFLKSLGIDPILFGERQPYRINHLSPQGLANFKLSVDDGPKGEEFRKNERELMTYHPDDTFNGINPKLKARIIGKFEPNTSYGLQAPYADPFTKEPTFAWAVYQSIKRLENSTDPMHQELRKGLSDPNNADYRGLRKFMAEIEAEQERIKPRGDRPAEKEKETLSMYETIRDERRSGIGLVLGNIFDEEAENKRRGRFQTVKLWRSGA